MSAQLHSVILLGNSDRVDGWMMADACKLAWAVADAKGEHHFICPGSPERYKGFSDGGFIIGEPRSDRLCIPVPAHIEIHRSPLVLKQQFLRHLSDLSKQIKPKDTLFIGLCSHGRETDGAVCVGNIDSSEDSDSEYLTITEVKAALRRKPAATRAVLWLTTCFSGYWTREPAWEAFAAARHGQESQSIPVSPSSQGMHILSSFIAHGEQSGVRYPYSVGGPEHYFNGIPLPPLFSHSLLARLTLIPHIALDYTTPMLPPISRTASVFVRTLPERLESLSLDPHVYERLLVLAHALNRDIDSCTLPTTPTFNKIATWVLDLGTPDFPTHVNAGIVLHALGQQAHLLFFADALHLTGAWSRSVAAAGKDVDLAKELSNRTGLTVQDLWEALETIHKYPQPPDSIFHFNWSTYPQINLDQVRDARAEVMVFVQRVGAENPELLCHCGQHLLLTDDEYEERVHQYRVDSLKETLLGMAPVPETCAISMSELRSVASAVGIATYDRPTLSSSATFP